MIIVPGLTNDHQSDQDDDDGNDETNILLEYDDDRDNNNDDKVDDDDDDNGLMSRFDCLSDDQAVNLLIYMDTPTLLKCSRLFRTGLDY